MGTSLVEFKGKGFWLNDSHFELLAHLLSREAENVLQRPDWLDGLIKQWVIQTVMGGTGCHTLSLDGILTSEDKVLCVLAIARKVRENIAQRKEPLSSEYIVNRFGQHMPFVGDVPKSWVLQGIDGLVKLLSGEYEHVIDNAPYLPNIDDK